MNTTYDDLYEAFLINCPNNEIPQTNEGKYVQIQNAIAFYNFKTNTYKDYLTSGIKGSNEIESIDVLLNDIEMLLFSHCMKFVYLSSKFTEFTQVWGVFTKEAGFSNYKGQVDARTKDIESTEKVIDLILEDSVTDWEV